MLNSLTVSRIVDRDTLQLTLAGEITEEAQFIIGDHSPRVVINLGGIRRMNSIGIRSWMHFTKTFTEGTEVLYTHCPTAFVTQASMIAHFLGPGRVLSFFAPYCCTQCDRYLELLLDIESDFPDRVPKAPVRHCDTCNKPLEFDEVEGVYLAFIKP